MITHKSPIVLMRRPDLNFLLSESQDKLRHSAEMINKTQRLLAKWRVGDLRRSLGDMDQGQSKT